MLGSFVPCNAADVHIIMTHISEKTLYTVIKFQFLFLSNPFDPIYDVLENSEHFLNFRRKWVKHNRNKSHQEESIH